MTPCANSWNAVYKLASNKTNRNQTKTTLLKPDGSLTSYLSETLKVMIDHLTPNDEQSDDTDHHKRMRNLSTEPIQTADDRNYTTAGVKNTIDDLNYKKAPGDGGITIEIYQRAYKQFPSFIYTIYNECLRKSCFPKKWEKVKIIPITKPGKETSKDVTKFRPISLINVGGKVLETILVNKIMHHV